MVMIMEVVLVMIVVTKMMRMMVPWPPKDRTLK
jgi:hypothetical protein